MPDHIDAESIRLDDLRKRIEATDLVLSRTLLLGAIETKLKALGKQGIATLAGLRHKLKNSKRLEALAKATAIDVQ